MRISPDRGLYLSRLLHERLKADPRILLETDEDTVRRAIAREVSEAGKELDSIEEGVRSDLEKRKGSQARDLDILFARGLEAALRKHGV